MNHKILVVFVALSLFCCGVSDITVKSQNNLPMWETIIFKDSINISPVFIKISLSQKARRIISETKESIIINLAISVEAEDFVDNSPYRYQALASEDGRIWLYDNSKTINLPDTVVVFENIKIPINLYNDLQTKKIYGFGQCYTGRKVFNNNLLRNTEFVDCDILKIGLGDIFTITAKLIEE